jgi:hypothetical protein
VLGFNFRNERVSSGISTSDIDYEICDVDNSEIESGLSVSDSESTATRVSTNLGPSTSVSVQNIEHEVVCSQVLIGQLGQLCNQVSTGKLNLFNIFIFYLTWMY